MTLPPPRKIITGLFLLFAVAQVIRPSRETPVIDPSRAIEARTDMTPDVEAILDRSCRDCHTSHTVWPWYSNVAPVSWLLISHVNEGRQHLSLSDWAAYDSARAGRKLREMCEQVRSGDMPMSSYVLMHASAALSDADKDLLCAWTDRARQALAP